MKIVLDARGEPVEESERYLRLGFLRNVGDGSGIEDLRPSGSATPVHFARLVTSNVFSSSQVADARDEAICDLD